MYHADSNMPMTPQDVEHQIIQNKALINDFEMKTDENGNGYIFGVKIPSIYKPAADLVIENAKPFILGQSENIYHGTVNLAGGLGIKGPIKNTVGAIVENGFRWGIIGIKQLYDFVQLNSAYLAARKDLFKLYEPVISATGATRANNEIIKSAFSEIDADWRKNVKLLTADIPTILALLRQGWKDQVIANKRHAQAKKNNVVAPDKLSGLKDDISAHKAQAQAQVREEVARTREIETEISKLKQEYINEQLASGATGYDKKGDEKKLTAKEIGSEFDRTYAAHAREFMNDQRQNKDVGQKNGDSEMMTKLVVPAATVISLILKTKIADAAKNNGDVKAWKMIQHLKQEVAEQCAGYEDGQTCNRSPDDIWIASGNTRVTLKEYVFAIFKQNERDYKRGGLEGSLAEHLAPIVDKIATLIASNQLHADALVDLVGAHKIILLNGGKRSIATEEQVNRALAPMRGSEEKTTYEDWIAKYADPQRAGETLKNNFETLQGMDKALVASLFSNEILEHIGIKKKEIPELRRQAEEQKAAFMVACAMEIVAKDVDKLKKEGLSDKDIEAVHDFIAQIKNGDKHVIEDAAHNPDLLDALRTHGINEQIATGKGSDYWSQRVKAIGSNRKKLEETISEAISEKEHGNIPKETPRVLSARDRELKRRDADPALGMPS